MQRILEECTDKKIRKKEKINKKKNQSQCAQIPHACRQLQQPTQWRSVTGKGYRKRTIQAIYSNCRSQAVSSLYPGGVTETQRASLPPLALSTGTADWTTGGRSNAKLSDEAGCELHLFSMSVCTLCTSSRAILRMCWTSCLSAISIKHNKKHTGFIYI